MTVVPTLAVTVSGPLTMLQALAGGSLSGQGRLFQGNCCFRLDSHGHCRLNTRFRIYAQVAQSVEQRTENTGNSRGKSKNRNTFF
jgi:hypothetical protein